MQIKIERSFTTIHQPLYQEIFDLTKSLKQSYPNYEHWYYQTFLNGLKRKTRSIIAVVDKGKVVGCALIKKTQNEKKLCTLFVSPDYRKQGLGEYLLRSSIDELGKNPLVSVSEKNKHFVDTLFRKYDFHLSAIKKGVYTPDVSEYYFNDERADSIQTKLIPVLIQRRKQIEKN